MTSVLCSLKTHIVWQVKESMHNLEEVVIERNRAYHELETGETGMRPSENVINQLGEWVLYQDSFDQSKCFDYIWEIIL